MTMGFDANFYVALDREFTIEAAWLSLIERT